MLITPTNLQNLQAGFQGAFLRGFEAVKAEWSMVAMEVNSSSAYETYAWLKDIPGVREFIGDRVIHNLEAQAMQIFNRKWEHTIGVDRPDIERDNLGLYANKFSIQGELVAAHPDELMFADTLLSGFTRTGFDGQYFFDSDHPGYDASGAVVSFSNVQAGAGAPWFLMDLSRSFMKPLIMQWERRPEFTALDRADDQNVFMKDQYLYGMYARYNTGYGFHQLAFGSKDVLSETNFEAALTALGSQYRQDKRKLPVRPTHLVVGATNTWKAKKIIMTEKNAAGADNVYKDAVKLLEVTWLP